MWRSRRSTYLVDDDLAAIVEQNVFVDGELSSTVMVEADEISTPWKIFTFLPMCLKMCFASM